MKVDLHTHSCVSDGTLSPSELVERAANHGVDMLALTDHDELSGLKEAARAAVQKGIRFIPGVEVSAVFGMDESIHIVGLGVDTGNKVLRSGLEKIRQGRALRAARMGKALAWLGIGDVYEGAKRFARNPELVNRAHFARYLVSKKVMPDIGTVFQHYLVPGKPGYVEHEWVSVNEAVSWIRAAGGIAVLAHPGRYRRLSSDDMSALLDTFIISGGEAIEVVSSAHGQEEISRFSGIARRLNLMASVGSDFHCERESRVDIGHCAPLPPGLEPVWSRLT